MKLYKFKSNNDFSHILDIITHSRLFVPSWKVLNDPMEAAFSFSSKPGDEKKWEKFEKALENTGICSLSEGFSNGLLWAYYANGYKGVAIEVEIPESELAQVEYIDSMPNIGSEWKLGHPKIERILSRKFDCWKHERERRLIKVGEKNFLYRRPSLVSKVIVGHRMPKHQIEILAWACSHSSIPIVGIENSSDGKSVYEVDLDMPDYAWNNDP